MMWAWRSVRALHTSLRRAKGTKALLPTGWEAVVGIECHAQLLAPTKLFSRMCG